MADSFSSTSYRIARLDRVRQGLRALSLDALVISHLPNIRYLTGLNGTAGLVVLTMSSCTLLVDFRYKSAAQALVRESGIGELVTVTVVPQGYDESLVAAIRETGARRIGVEAAWLPVSRFNKLSSALAAAAPTPLQSPLAPPALVPTERVVESARLVKDDAGDCDAQGSGAAAGRRRRAGDQPGAGGEVRVARCGRGRRASPRRRFRAAGVRDHRRFRAPGRLAARTAGPAGAGRGRWRGAGLWRRLRRILRGFDANGAAGRHRRGFSPDVRCGRGCAARGDSDCQAGNRGERGRCRSPHRARPIRIGRGVRPRHGPRAGPRSARGAARSAALRPASWM